MQINDKLVNQIVDAVVQRLSENTPPNILPVDGDSPQNSDSAGIFQNMDDCIPAAVTAQKKLLTLSFDKVEFEPEQFPAIIYRVHVPKVVILVFSSGKLVVTGGRSDADVIAAIRDLEGELRADGHLGPAEADEDIF